MQHIDHRPSSSRWAVEYVGATCRVENKDATSVTVLADSSLL